MKCGINDKVPSSKATLVPIGVDLIWIVILIRDHLVKFPAFKFYLFFVILILHDVCSSFVTSAIVGLLLTSLLIINLISWDRYALSAIRLVIFLLCGLWVNIVCRLLQINSLNVLLIISIKFILLIICLILSVLILL
jgi:hypothetical protein